MDQKIDRRVGKHHHFYVPTFTSGHELWIITESTGSLIQVAGMGFLWRGSASEELSHPREAKSRTATPLHQGDAS